MTKDIAFTYEEKEEAESLLIQREKTWSHPNAAGLKSALVETRMAVWKGKMTRAQAYNLWEAAEWSLERVLSPFASRAKFSRIKSIKDKLLDVFQEP